MKRVLRTAVAALLVLCASAPSAAGQGAARNLLYRVEGPDGATVYLLGSIHLLTADAYPLAPQVERAYADAERVVFEVDLDSLRARADEMMPRAILTGRTLRDVLPPDLYARVEQAAAKHARMGLDMTVLDRFEPWMVAMMLSQLEWAEAGLQAEHGIDLHFQGRAQRDGKTVGSLESVDFQLSLLDGFSPEHQLDLLRQALDDLPRVPQMMREITAAWRAGDADAIDVAMNGSMGRYPQLYATMLTDRNAAWVPQIERMLRGRDDVLVVVGAAHLAGVHSVVSMLRQRGYTVDQL